MKKIWLDCETTGLDSNKHGIVQLSMLVENSKGKVIDEFDICIKPKEGCQYDDKALEINGKTFEEIQTFTPEAEAFKELIKFLNKHIDPRDKADKFTPCGYNVNFDNGFVQALFRRNGHKFYGAYFNYYDVDTFALVKILDLEGRNPDTGLMCKKLGALCDTFGVKLGVDAHNSLADIKATRKLHKKIMKKYVL